MSITNLKRYYRRSRQLEKESKRLDRWAQLMPIGQPFPSYERASMKHALSFEKQLFPLWDKIRHRVDITKSGKTLWQHFPLHTKSFPPLFREIEPLLKLDVMRLIQPEPKQVEEE